MACEEGLAAHFAFESLDAAVDLHVLAEVALLLEGLGAFGAVKGPVIRMDQ